MGGRYQRPSIITDRDPFEFEQHLEDKDTSSQDGIGFEGGRPVDRILRAAIESSASGIDRQSLDGEQPYCDKGLVPIASRPDNGSTGDWRGPGAMGPLATSTCNRHRMGQLPALEVEGCWSFLATLFLRGLLRAPLPTAQVHSPLVELVKLIITLWIFSVLSFFISVVFVTNICVWLLALFK